MPIRIINSMRTTKERTMENPVNFPRMITPLRIGFESIRYIVRPSISRAISQPARKRITANPESSKKESQKSIITRLLSPRARESSPRDRAIRIMERKIINEKNRLRTNSRKVLRAILNIINEKLKYYNLNKSHNLLLHISEFLHICLRFGCKNDIICSICRNEMIVTMGDIKSHK